MGEENFYSGRKLLSKLDLDGNKPELIICDGTRTAGKTFYFKDEICLRPLLECGEKFGLVCRYQNMGESLPEAFISDLAERKYPGFGAECKPVAKGKIFRIIIHDNHNEKKYDAGFVFPITSLEFIKINSSMFVNIDKLFFDEFQNSKGKYLSGEVDDLQKIHTSIARGGGKHKRHVPLYMCANSLDLFNPYYIRMGICTRLQEDTRFLRGHGWVMEHTVNAEARQHLLEGGVATALSSNQDEITGDKYLNSKNLVVNKRPSSCVVMYGFSDGNKVCYLWSGRIYGSFNLLITGEDKKLPINCDFYSLNIDSIGTENGGDMIMPIILRHRLIMYLRKGMVFFLGMKSREYFFKLFDKFI